MAASDTSSAPGSLVEVIGRHLAGWAEPHVELAIHGHGDASAIAGALAAFCQRELGAGVRGALFYQSSIGAVAGLELADGRRVVVKAHQPNRSLAELEEVARLQGHLARAALFAPAVLAGPAPFGRGFASAEAYVDGGAVCDAHEPAVRAALAQGLAAIVHELSPFVERSRLRALVERQPAGRLWGTPHSKLFDFEATRLRAEDIDAVASAAQRRFAPVGRLVLGHGDWRAEHVLFQGRRATWAFDWDSLHREREPALIGCTAHAFCANHAQNVHAQAPTLDEARGFVADYEAARGEAFTAAERVLVGACFAYSVAYTARCAHAEGLTERTRSGTFRALITDHGQGLLEL